MISMYFMFINNFRNALSKAFRTQVRSNARNTRNVQEGCSIKVKEDSTENETKFKARNRKHKQSECSIEVTTDTDSTKENHQIVKSEPQPGHILKVTAIIESNPHNEHM